MTPMHVDPSKPHAKRAGPALVLLGLVLAATTLTAVAYWPGLMTWDAVRQYGQALDGGFDDWHPPAMEWLWRQLVPVHRGPAPMLVLQLALYWSGFAGMAALALRRRRTGLAVALAACGLLPLASALMGAVLKDCLMAGALSSATAMLMWSARAGPRVKTLLGGLVIVLLLLAATLRFNAFLACLPLLMAALPAGTRDRPWRFVVTAAIGTLALMAAMPVANRLLDAKPSGVALSLVIFDLGGITEHSGIDVFPPLGVRHAVAANHRCYSPVKWDPYSDWVDPPCPLGFVPFRAAATAGRFSPYGVWLKAIVHHPVAYAEHRLAHFNINTRFLVHDEIERPVQVESAPNPWGYKVGPNRALTLVDGMAVASAHTPIGWPIVWLALAAGALFLGWRLPSRHMVIPLASSSLLYGFGYAVFSVAAELRYHLWTEIAALIACVIVAGDIAAMPARPWSRIGRALAPALIVALLGIAWRVTPL